MSYGSASSLMGVEAGLTPSKSSKLLRDAEAQIEYFAVI